MTDLSGVADAFVVGVVFWGSLEFAVGVGPVGGSATASVGSATEVPVVADGVSTGATTGESAFGCSAGEMFGAAAEASVAADSVPVGAGMAYRSSASEAAFFGGTLISGLADRAMGLESAGSLTGSAGDSAQALATASNSAVEAFGLACKKLGNAKPFVVQ